jgi:uridine kinase
VTTASQSSARAKVIGRVADHLLAHRPGHPLRVAVDGITAAGKTTLANEIAAALRDRRRPVLRLSMDGYHHPRAHRYRQGRDSAVGYYQDAYDLTRFAELVLDPLGPNGDRRYVPAILDLATDRALDPEPEPVPPDAVLVVDGSFLQRAELAGLWDDVVFVNTHPDHARARGVARDIDLLGGAAAAQHAYTSRYHAACRLYLDKVDPAAQAGIVIDNNTLEQPILQRIGGTAADTEPLFSYGTLQQPDAQLATFGRQLTGTPDQLPGYRHDWVTVTDPAVVAASGSDRHPIVRATDDPADFVAGTVLTLTTTELAAADHYEVDDYRRVHVTLASGAGAWVYLAADGDVPCP